MVVAVSQSYIDMIKAFRADCDKLIEIIKKENKNDIQTFFRVWHQLNFNCIYTETERVQFSKHGMQQDFMHDTLQIAKLIMFREDFSIGMFLLYGLFTLQNNPLASIRLMLDEFLHILRILRIKDEDEDKDQAVKKNRVLALIFSTLLKENAFDFVLFSREYDMEGQHHAQMIYNNRYEFSDDESAKALRPRDWLRNLSKDLPREMLDLEHDYLKMKSKIKAVFPYLNLSLDMVKEDITTTLLRSITQGNKPAEPQEIDISIGARRRSLKDRKMKVRHRYEVEEEDEEEEESSSDEIPMKLMKKRGCPKGERKSFFDQAINDPDINESSENKDHVAYDGMPLKLEDILPNLL